LIVCQPIQAQVLAVRQANAGSVSLWHTPFLFGAAVENGLTFHHDDLHDILVGIDRAAREIGCAIAFGCRVRLRVLRGGPWARGGRWHGGYLGQKDVQGGQHQRVGRCGPIVVESVERRIVHVIRSAAAFGKLWS
jgi:hypothetical protein